MENTIEKVRSFLINSIDEKYRSFNQSLVPGESSEMLGVRIPQLREIAKRIARESGIEYIRAIEEMEKKAPVYHEELLLHGMIIG